MKTRYCLGGTLGPQSPYPKKKKGGRHATPLFVKGGVNYQKARQEEFLLIRGEKAAYSREKEGEGRTKGHGTRARSSYFKIKVTDSLCWEGKGSPCEELVGHHSKLFAQAKEGFELASTRKSRGG